MFGPSPKIVHPNHPHHRRCLHCLSTCLYLVCWLSMIVAFCLGQRLFYYLGHRPTSNSHFQHFDLNFYDSFLNFFVHRHCCVFRFYLKTQVT